MLYENIIKRESNLDKNDKLLSAYDQVIMNEGKEEAEAIRGIIKKKFGLTSRDVSVKTRSGSMSSAVTVSAKTVKALPYLSKIKEISKDFQRYERDQATGSILGGGNTFIFTDIDWQYHQKLVKKIEAELEKQITDDFLNDIGTNIVEVFGYKVVKEKGEKIFYVPHPKNRTVGQTNMSTNRVAERVLSLMIELGDNKNLKKIG